MRGHAKFGIFGAGSAAVIAALLAATPAAAQEQARAFNIPAGDLGPALNAYARQSDQQIMFTTELVAGRRTAGLKGRFTSGAALDRLLSGTGLTVASRRAGVVTLGAGAGGGARAEATSVEEVIVTAQKASENIQKVPLSVTALSSDTLTSYGQFHLTDFASLIPGLEVDSIYGVPGDVSITIRGISTASFDGSNTVATYVDDVPVSSSTSFSSGAFVSTDLLTYDIDHVEVLKGPQGTLYGASSMGGLLKYVTKTPDLRNTSIKLGADSSIVENGSQVGWGLHGSANIALASDKLGVIVSAAHETIPGYIDNVATGAKGFNHGTQDGGRFALLWNPSDRFSMKLQALYDRADFKGFGVIAADPVTQEPTYGYLKFSAVEPNGQIQATTLLSANLSYDFGPVKLTSVTGYSRAATILNADASPIFFPIFGVDVAFKDHISTSKLTQEFRLVSPDSTRLRWMVGAFYTHEKDVASDSATSFDPITQEPIPALNPFFYSNGHGELTELAAFGNATYDLTSNWDVNAGFRYNHDALSFNSQDDGLLNGGPSTTVFQPASSTAWTYSFSTRYHFSQDVMAYGRIATGFRPGGLNGSAPGAPPSYGPDKLINYEAGLKSEWFDRRLLVDVAAFYIDWTNIQIEEVTPLNFYFFANASEAKSSGFEFTSSYVAAPGLKFGLNVAYTDATLSADTPALGALKGDRLPNSSKWTGAFTADYTHPLTGDYDGRVGLVWRYVGDRNSSFPMQAGNEHLGAYDVLDLSAGISNPRWSLNLYLRNVADKRTYLSWSGQLGPAILQPRSVGLSVNTSF